MSLVEEYRDDDLMLDFYPNFIPEDVALSLFKVLMSDTNWPRALSDRRRTKSLYGDEGLVYNINWYGKTSTYPVTSWSDFPILEAVKNLVAESTGERYTVCVVQHYPNGTVGINPHRDREMVHGTIIAGISLGSTRKLRMSRGCKNIELNLTPGSLYLLRPPTNDKWAHSISKDETTEPRISLTFRNYVA